MTLCRELWERIGRGELRRGGGWGRCKQHIKHMFCDLLQLLRGFLYWKDHFKKKQQTTKSRTIWSSTEQASNDTVSKNLWRYLLSNPDKYIYIYMFQIKWKILKKCKTYSNINKKCSLCLNDKFIIICQKELCSLKQKKRISKFMPPQKPMCT